MRGVFRSVFDSSSKIPLGPVNPIRASSVASKNWARRGGARRLWRDHRRGRQRSVAQFWPQPEGRGRIFPIASSLVAKIHPVFVTPRFSHSKKSAPLAVVLIGLTGPSSVEPFHAP